MSTTTLEPRAGIIPVEVAEDVSARYGIYVLAKSAPLRVAECEQDAIGVTLVQLAEDHRESGETAAETFGVLDQVERRWISGLWPRRF